MATSAIRLYSSEYFFSIATSKLTSTLKCLIDLIKYYMKIELLDILSDFLYIFLLYYIFFIYKEEKVKVYSFLQFLSWSS